MLILQNVCISLINLARDYGSKRKAFGKLINDHDLHLNTLASMEFECRASFLTLMLCAKLLGKIECNQASKEDNELFRIVVPLLKLYTAKQVRLISLPLSFSFSD